MPKLPVPKRLRQEASVKATKEAGKKALRLSYELEAIEAATWAAWLLSEELRTGQFAEESHFELAPKAIAGVLALVSVRLHHVRALLGDREGHRRVRDLWALHNDASGERAEGGENHRDLMVLED